MWGPAPPLVSAQQARSWRFYRLARVLAEAQDLFAVVDTARDEQALALLRPSQVSKLCLYSGETALRLANYAPYLVPLSDQLSLTRALLGAGWGRSWFILLASGQPPEAVARQLRKSLIVTGPNGKPLYFRFYDPRVLRAYLQTCSPDMALRLVGEAIDTLYCENHQGSRVYRYRRLPAQLIRDDLAL